MIVILYNPIGLMMCFVPMVLASFAWVYLPYSRDVWTLVGPWAVVVIVWDILYRVFNRDQHWLSPTRGGHIFFIPVCVLAAGALWWYANHALTVGYWLPHLL